MHLYYFVLNNLAGGIWIDSYYVFKAPPVFRNWEGRSFGRFAGYIKNKGGTLELTSLAVPNSIQRHL